MKKLPEMDTVRRSLNGISEAARLLDEAARDLGSRYGLHGVPFHPPPPDGYPIILTRYREKWGVYHMADNALKPIMECRIEIRIAFVRHAKAFFDQYMDHVKKTFSGLESLASEGRELARKVITMAGRSE